MAKEELTIMVVDSSARAHAVSEAYEKSPNVKKIIVTPGNDFIGYNRKKEIIIEPGKLTDPKTFLEVAKKYKPDLVDVCQDDALALGTVDLLNANGFVVFGTSKSAARIESDKAWSREFMRACEVPHPWYHIFTSQNEGIDFVRTFYSISPESLLFVKASGLCGGKGAIPARTLDEAIAAIQEMKSFKDAGDTYLIENGMVGEEASIYSFSDGHHFVTVKPSQDHKRRDNFDQGPNTGGMGAIAPAGVITDAIRKSVNERVVRPTILGMAANGHPYVGVLYSGVMVTTDGTKVVEFNSRWGAPEAEVVVPGIRTHMDRIAFACINSELDKILVDEDDLVRVCVVGASRGYPGDVRGVKGKQIYGLEEVMNFDDISIYGAGIAVRDGKFYANGGRLFSIVAEGPTVTVARRKALGAMSLIHVEGHNLHYRTDIGWRDVERKKKTQE